MNKNTDRLSIRFSPFDFLKICELSDSLKVSKSLLIRTIVQNFIISKEDTINNLIDKYNADNK